MNTPLPVIRKCKHCGKPLLATRYPSTEYCCLAHKNAAYLRRRRARDRTHTSPDVHDLSTPGSPMSDQLLNQTHLDHDPLDDLD